MQTQIEPEALVYRLQRATNEHDLEALVDCFAPGYCNETPAHPERGFTGSERVRANWTQIFSAIPDVTCEVLRCAADGDTVWSEWHWHGTQAGGTLLDMVGVFVCGVRDQRIAWARLYMEPVEHAGAGIESAVRRMTGDD